MGQFYPAVITQFPQSEPPIAENEAWFRTSVEALLDGLAIFSSVRDEDGRIVDFCYEYINETGCQLNRRSAAEQIGHTLLELLPRHKEMGLVDEYIRVVETGAPYIKESLFYEDVYGGGQRLARAFDVRATKLGDGFVVHWRDVNKRKQLEQSETEQRALAEALEEIARLLNGTLCLEEVFDRILHQIGRVIPSDAVHIMLIEAGVARIVRSRGYAERGRVEGIADVCLKVKEVKNLQIMAETGRPIAVTDTQNSPDWMALPGSGWIGSYAGAPLQVKGQVTGFINANSATPGFYTQVHARRLQAFANQAALAIENARLFEEVQRFARQSALLNDITHTAISAPDKRTMLQILSDRLGELVYADGVFITLWDEAQQMTIPAAAYGPHKHTYMAMQIEPGETTLTASVLAAGRVLAVDDVSNTPYISPRLAVQYPAKTVLGLPLIADGKKIGAALINYNQAHHFSPEEIAIASQAAGQIALAIWKTHLFETQQEQTAQLARANRFILALGHVAARIETASGPEEVLSTLGEELRQMGIACTVAMHNPETQTLQIQYLSIKSRATALAERLTGVGLRDLHLSREWFLYYQQVIEQGQAVFTAEPLPVIAAALPDLNPHLLQRFLRVIGMGEMTRIIFLPLIAREKVIGTLWIWGENLQESDLKPAMIFASQVASALENARLYSEIKRLAVTDDLTGLYNRRGGLELGQREFKRALYDNRPLAAILIDIDHFKAVNDTHGHVAGDQVLQALAARFREHLRVNDIIVRWGGEEFLVLLPEANLAAAHQIAERLRRQAMELEIPAGPKHVHLTISVGVAERNAGLKDLTELIKRADEALYLAKESGRNQVVAG